MSSITKKTEHICYEPHAGKANCYHCGESYQITPCSMPMITVILKQFGKEHKKCKEQEAGKALLAKVIKDNEGKANDSLGILKLKPNATLGEKIAHNLEMQMISKALKGDIPDELRASPKFMKAIEEMKAAGVTLELSESG